jgi:uncharacterized protein YndB with AHSA1/START domain
MATLCFCEFSYRSSLRHLEFPPEKRQHRKGGNLMAKVHVERTIAASPERVFDWLLDPANLTVSPVFRKAVWAKDSSGPGVGATREVTGIGFWAHEQITAYDPPRSCSYLAVRSFPASEHKGGTLTCTPSGDGTHVDWVSGYTLPVRAGGQVMEVVTLPLIRSLAFRAILAGCAKALES